MSATKGCEHHEFVGDIRVGRITEKEGGPVTSYMVDLSVKCSFCDRPFLFVGVEAGLNMIGGARVDVSARTLSCRIHPDDGSSLPALKGPTGFSVKRTL